MSFCPSPSHISLPAKRSSVRASGCCWDALDDTHYPPQVELPRLGVLERRAALTRGPSFPLSRLESRLMCLACRNRRTMSCSNRPPTHRWVADEKGTRMGITTYSSSLSLHGTQHRMGLAKGSRSWNASSPPFLPLMLSATAG